MNEIFKRISVRKFEDRPQEDRYDETRIHYIE